MPWPDPHPPLPPPPPPPQARLLWPEQPLECLVSLGCGLGPPVKRERSVSTVLDTGNVLIESACSTDRVDEAVATLLSLQPSIKYFRCVCVCVCLLYAYNLCVCVCHYAYMCGCACMYVYAFVCVCVCVCGGGSLENLAWDTHAPL